MKISTSTLQLINDALKIAVSYEEYKKNVENLFAQDLVTGDTQSDDLLHYTKLNISRVKRWEKTLKVKEESILKIKSIDKELTWLVISEGWCGDAAHSLPVMHQLSGYNENIQLKIVLRDQHPDLMDSFLTNGSRSIPKLIQFDEKNHKVLGVWGPRPSVLQQQVEDYKQKHGSLDAEFKENLQRWYNQDKGQTIIADLLDLVERA